MNRGCAAGGDFQWGPAPACLEKIAQNTLDLLRGDPGAVVGVAGHRGTGKRRLAALLREQLLREQLPREQLPRVGGLAVVNRVEDIPTTGPAIVLYNPARAGANRACKQVVHMTHPRLDADADMATLTTCIACFRDTAPSSLGQLAKYDAACRRVASALEAMVDPDFVDHAYDHTVWLTPHPPPGAVTNPAHLPPVAPHETVLVHVDPASPPPNHHWATELLHLTQTAAQLRFTCYPWFFLLPG